MVITKDLEEIRQGVVMQTPQLDTYLRRGVLGGVIGSVLGILLMWPVERLSGWSQRWNLWAWTYLPLALLIGVGLGAAVGWSIWERAAASGKEPDPAERVTVVGRFAVFACLIILTVSFNGDRSGGNVLTSLKTMFLMLVTIAPAALMARSPRAAGGRRFTE